MQPRRLLALVSVAVLVPLISGCADKSKPITHAETEGVYVDVGHLKYQVQVSRELAPPSPDGADPAVVEDKTFLEGVADASLAADEEWFAVFIRVQNDTDAPHRSAERYEIVDTEGNTYEPVAIDATVNPFGYQAGTLPAGAIVPDPDSIPAQTSLGGLELLFKLKRASTDNRPLELEITSPTNAKDVGVVNLDV